MRIFFRFCVVAASLLNVTSPVLAGDVGDHGWYVKMETGYSRSRTDNFAVQGGGTGWVRPGDDFSGRIGNAWLLGGGAGYRISPLIRTDLVYSEREGFSYANDFQLADRHRQFDVKSKNLLANVYLDIPGIDDMAFGRFTPYIGAGIGIARNTTSKYQSTSLSTGAAVGAAIPNHTETSTAYQVMVGAGVELSKRFALDVGYRFINLGKIEVKPAGHADTLKATSSSSQELYLGVRYDI